MARNTPQITDANRLDMKRIIEQIRHLNWLKQMDLYETAKILYKDAEW